MACWAPGSLSDDSWAESGDLALRMLPAEIHLLSWAGHWWEDQAGGCASIQGRGTDLNGAPSS